MRTSSSLDSRSAIESSIYSYYVRYNKLIELVNKYYDGYEAENLDIFVDVFSIVRSLARRGLTDPYQYTDIPYLAGGLINLCAHYRGFFRSKYNVQTRFYLILSNEIYSGCINEYMTNHTKYCPNYIKTYFPKGLNTDINRANLEKTVTLNAGVLNSIIPYIPDVDFIQTYQEFSTTVMQILDFNEMNYMLYPALVISRDQFNMTLISNPAYDIKKLHPLKDMRQDMSYIVDKSNIWDLLSHRMNSVHIPTNLSPQLLTAVLALCRCKDRALGTKFNYNKTMTIMNEMVNNLEINNSYNHLINLLTAAFFNHVNTAVAPTEIDNRFKAIDPYFNLLALKGSPYANSYRGIMNLYDPQGLKTLNETVFQNMPLDLNNL